jgi:hypothetical protein
MLLNKLNKNINDGINGFAILPITTNLNDIDCNAIIHATDSSQVTLENGYPAEKLHCTVISVIKTVQSSGTRFGFQDVIYRDSSGGSYRRYIYIEWEDWKRIT